MRGTHDLAFFSSVSENTRRFVERVGRPADRIPLRPRHDGMLTTLQPFVLVVPTYGGGAQSGAVPKQVVQFLNVPENRISTPQPAAYSPVKAREVCQ